MDYQRFLQELPGLYENWGYESVCPKSDRFQAILDQVQGTTTANIIQLLNLAVECIEPDEIYCQIGCFPVEHLIGALLDNSEKMAYVVDNFSEVEADGKNQEKLFDKLDRFKLDRQIFFLEQNVEEFFCDLKEILPEAKIGVFFYDGSPDYRSQLLALLLVKPFLADQGLIIIDDSKLSAVQQANWDFLTIHPACQLVVDLPNFGNGIHILTWDINQKNVYKWDELAENYRNESLLEAMREFNCKFEEKKNKALKIIFKEAESLQRIERFAEAEQKYNEILEWDSKAADVWHNLGLIYYKKEQYQDGIEMLVKALQIDPSVAKYHYSLGLMLERSSNVPEAIRAYEQAIACDPNFVDAYNNIGNIWLAAGELVQAESIYRQAIAVSPNHYGSYLNLGNLSSIKNQLDEAIEYYQKALQLKPNEADIAYNLGLAFAAKQEPAEAAKYFGYAAYKQENYAEAIEHYQKLLSGRIGDINSYHIWAECHKKLHQIEATINTYQLGIKQYPNSSYLYLMLAISLQDFGRTEDAIKVASEGSQLFPNDLILQIEKQHLLPVIYETTEEIDCYRSRFTNQLEELIQSTKLDTQSAINNATIGISMRTNFYLQYQGKNDLELQIKYGEFVHKIMSAKYPQWVRPLTMPPLGEDGKIRIGYISDYMYYHSGGVFALGWLKNHDSQKFEVYSYYTNRKSDQITEQFWLYSQVFHNIPEDLAKICQQIIDDKLHILVFLDIGMSPQTTPIAGLRLAPIQCNTWGHPITSGSPTLDYFLSSELMEPENGQEHYSEELICLPKISCCYSKPLLPEPRKNRSEFQLCDDDIVYLSSQSTYKYLPQYDYIFPTIAIRVPQARFMFISSHISSAITEKFRLRLKKAFASIGLNSEEYCSILPRMNSNDYLCLNLVSDVYLDTLSWSGANTTLQAIACNLPIVTCPGEFMRGRHSYGILKMLGVTETIAKDESEYIEIAVRLGLDPEWRKTIVQKVIARNSRVYEDKICVAALEEFYQRVVWENQQ